MKFRIFIIDGEAIEWTCIEIYEGISDEDYKNAGFYCYFLYIWLIVENDEVHIEEA